MLLNHKTTGYDHFTMKIMGLLLVFCLHAHLSFAQFEKGKAAVGLNLGFSYDNDDGDSYSSNEESSFATDLHGELFVHRNLSVVIGIGLEQGNSHSMYSTTDSINNRYVFDITANSRIVSPIIGMRKYWFEKGGKVGLFVMPYAIVSFTNMKYESSLTGPTYKNISEGRKEYWSPYFKTDIGFCYFVKPNFSLELTSNIIQAYVDNNQQYVYFLRDLNSFRYGVRYYF